MRILHIIQTLDPSAGGTAEAVRLLVEFAPQGMQPEIVTLDDPGAEFLKLYACPVHALGRASGLGISRKLVPWLRLHRADYDAAIAHGMWNMVAHATRRGLNGRIPYAVFPHGMLDPWFARQFPLKHAKKWAYWLLTEYWTLRAARRVLFTTRREAELARESFWLHTWKPAIVPLGTAPLPAATDADREAFLAACPEVRERRFLLFLGRLHPKKGVNLLLNAFLRVAGAEPQLDLVLAGPHLAEHAEWVAGMKRELAVAGFAERVHWPGMVEGAAKRGAFALCEAFVLPSHQENFGIAVVEALAAGRAVLLSDQVNIAPEIAADGAGLMQPDTLSGTLALLTRWLEMSAFQRQRMGDLAAETFTSRYDMRVNAALLADVFQR